MSADVVDDLHAAEDMAGRLAEALRFVLADVDFDGQVDARVALASWDEYCRPGCGWRDQGVCDDADLVVTETRTVDRPRNVSVRPSAGSTASTRRRRRRR
jgi:hypothetical protein